MGSDAQAEWILVALSVWLICYVKWGGLASEFFGARVAIGLGFTFREDPPSGSILPAILITHFIS